MTVDPGLIDWTERVYLSQFSAPPLTLTVYIAGQPGDPDGQSVTGRLFMDNPDGTSALVDELAAVREQPGIYVVTPSSADTQTPGYAQLDWAYAISGQQQQYASYLEIGPANPHYDALPPEMQDFLNDQVWVRFADIFDSAGGGPNLQAYFQSRWSRGRAAQMMGIALQKINAAAQPWSSYTLDGNGGPQYPIQFWGGLLASYAYIECVKQLIRAYTEQPQFMGPPVARQDRRDYADRWREAIKDEQAELKGLLDVFKIRHILNGSPRVLVSGGTYGNYAPTRIAGSVAARPRMWARWYLSAGQSTILVPSKMPRQSFLAGHLDLYASIHAPTSATVLIMSTSKKPWQRYEEKLIPRDDGCTGWGGKIDKYGNAQFTWTDDDGTHRTGGAHSWAWRNSRGPVPAGYGLRNTCGLRSCQNLGHWRVKPRNGSNSPWEKYEARVDRSGGADACHPWTEGRDADGYPILTFSRDGKYITVRAQRWAWDQIHPDDKMTQTTMVCHRCDNPPCCNEGHWFKDTPAGNTADMRAKGRATGPGRGERHHASTATRQFVDMARAEYEEAGRRYGMQTALAKKYNVNRRWLADVLSGKRWVDGPEARVRAPRTFSSKRDRKIIWDRDDGICQLCLLPIDPDLPYRDPGTGKINLMSKSIDHIIPVARGGAHSLENAQLAHFGCNQSKNVRVRTHGT